MQATYEVKGMSCQGCVKSVAGAIAANVPNVETDVSLEDASVTIRGQHDPAAVERAVEEAGFTFGGPRG
ncbi:MAG: heavy-metal-associated domain-containing protein [Myxococcota bacterium]